MKYIVMFSAIINGVLDPYTVLAENLDSREEAEAIIAEQRKTDRLNGEDGVWLYSITAIPA